MGLRIPTNTVLTAQTTDLGTSSVAGGLGFPFLIPQDTDNVVVKFTASVIGGGMSALFQTSDDGGTTYYDVARTSIVSNGLTPQWLTIPTIQGPTIRASVVAVGSIALTNNIGSAAASTLGQGQFSGLPILGVQNRIFLQYSGSITVSSVVAIVKVNNQSASR